MSGSSAFKRSIGHFRKKLIPYFEILGPTILLQIYPIFCEIMDERGVILSSPGRDYELMADMPKSILEFH